MTFNYFKAQLKRTAKLAASVFPVAMLLFAFLAAAVWFFVSAGPLSEGQKKYRIGIVGDVDITYLKFGFYAVKTLDSSRFLVDFEPMSEDEAREEFKAGDLTAYVIIPDGFLDSIIHGRNDVQIEYIATDGQKGIESFLMDELSVTLSDIVTSSQSAIYSMQHAARYLGMTEELPEWTDEFNLKLIMYVLDRTGFAKVEELGISKGLLVRQYYFCTMILLFCFMFGISSAPMFLRRNNDLGIWMKVRGLTAWRQVLCEYGAYCLFMIFCLSVPLWVIGAATGNMSFLHNRVYFGELLSALIPISLMVSSFHFAIYEWIGNPVSNLLFQFIGILGMVYISGYIYPASFFPDSLAAIGGVLPTGIAMDVMAGNVFGVGKRGSMIVLIVYTAAFLCITCLGRKRSIESDRG